MNLEKKLNNSENFEILDTDSTFLATNFTILNGAFSSYQTSLPCALRLEIWSCVWMGNSSKTKFLHQQDLGLWDEWSSKFFNSLSTKLARILNFSDLFAEFSPLASSRKMYGSSVLPKPPLFHTIPCNFLVNQTACFVGLYFFEKRNKHLRTFASKRTPKSLKTCLSSISLSSTMQDILLQKPTKLKMEGKRSFT